MEEENKNPASNQEGHPAPTPPEGTETNPSPAPAVDGQGTPVTDPVPNDPKPEAEKKQSREEDSRYAQMRHQKEVEKAKAAGDAEGYKRARIKSVGGKNPYADDAPIETDEDFELYELQDEIKQKGGNPSSVREVDALRREKAAEAKRLADEARSDEEKRQQQANAEVDDYLKEHSKDELNAHWKNPEFQEFSKGLLGFVPLKVIIEKFDKAHPSGENPEGKHAAAANIASPGSATNAEQPVAPKKVNDMSKEEFEKYYKEVSEGKRKI